MRMQCSILALGSLEVQFTRASFKQFNLHTWNIILKAVQIATTQTTDTHQQKLHTQQTILEKSNLRSQQNLETYVK